METSSFRCTGSPTLPYGSWCVFRWFRPSIISPHSGRRLTGVSPNGAVALLFSAAPKAATGRATGRCRCRLYSLIRSSAVASSEEFSSEERHSCFGWRTIPLVRAPAGRDSARASHPHLSEAPRRPLSALPAWRVARMRGYVFPYLPGLQGYSGNCAGRRLRRQALSA